MAIKEFVSISKFGNYKLFSSTSRILKLGSRNRCKLCRRYNNQVWFQFSPNHFKWFIGEIGSRIAEKRGKADSTRSNEHRARRWFHGRLVSRDSRIPHVHRWQPRLTQASARSICNWIYELVRRHHNFRIWINTRRNVRLNNKLSFSFDYRGRRILYCARINIHSY